MLSFYFVAPGVIKTPNPYSYANWTKQRRRTNLYLLGFQVEC